MVILTKKMNKYTNIYTDCLMTFEEFDKLSRSINHPWIKRKQLNDYDINNYLDIKFKKISESKCKVTIKDKNDYPEYRLLYLLIQSAGVKKLCWIHL